MEATSSAQPDPTGPVDHDQAPGAGGGGGPAGGAAGGSTPSARLIDALARRASTIVEQAASILEEEVAAGIVAARKAEDRYVGLDRLQSAETHRLLHRFRKDAHEIVDLMIDLVGVSADMLGNLARNAIALGGSEAGAGAGGGTGGGTGGGQGGGGAALKPETGGIPLLSVPRLLAPGETGTLTLNIDNDKDQPTAPFSFHASGLFGADGHPIPADRISFAPQEVSVAAAATAAVTIAVAVPAGTPAGEYAGLIQTSALPQARAVLTVRVGAP